jgi:hypothetical protein
MLSEKGGPNQENIVDTSLLLDAITSLIDAFKQAGYNLPVSVRLDKRAFDRLLQEASKLYSSVNVKDSIENQEFSIAHIMNIILEGKNEKTGTLNNSYYLQEQNDIPQTTKSTGKDQGKQGRLSLSATTTKYECPDCKATFDTHAGHRKHHQAFHDKIEDPKIIEQRSRD